MFTVQTFARQMFELNSPLLRARSFQHERAKNALVTFKMSEIADMIIANCLISLRIFERDDQRLLRWRFLFLKRRKKG